MVTLLCGMVVDLVAPSMPAIASDLNASVSLSKAIIAWYLLGYALGNFVAGILADSMGRRTLLRGSLFIFFIVSLVPIYFPHITVLLVMRFLQGLSIGIAAVCARAIVADLLTPQQLIRAGTLISTMWGVGPVVGPIIGGYLQYYIGWHANFFFLAMFALLSLLVVFFIVPETHQNKSSINIANIRHSLGTIIRHDTFLALVVQMGLLYALIIVFNTLVPFLIQVQWHQSSIVYGHVSFFMGVSFLLATFFGRKLLKHFSVSTILNTTLWVVLIVSITGVGVCHAFPRERLPLVIFSGLSFFAIGIVFPLSMGKAMSYFKDRAGLASAVMLLISILLTSVASFMSGHIHISSSTELMGIFVFLFATTTVLYRLTIAAKIR